MASKKGKKQEEQEMTAIDKELAERHFRVVIFGSARIKEGDEVYKQVYELGKMIGQKRFDIVTGGGPGLMDAANAGHMAGDVKNEADSIGIRINLPFEQNPNKHLEIKKNFDKFSNRLDQFMTLSNVVVIVPGGVGTCLEFFYTWQLTQVKHICRIPIILIGDMWSELMRWVEKYPMKNGLISPKDAENVCVVPNNDAAMKIIEGTYKTFVEKGPDYCVNVDKYKI